ncbi:MAG TPA: hypothetical protein DCX32_04355 [Candidatus Moranbacteria bacterium]|nr:MAG: hypothetical protein UW87_C0002G0007 [Candidatus Moranbacteria bacterium GW2011_GWC2_45_10]KKT95178.1 MAG: hypothetical protein UW95_C0003G0020 [Parcubacteria group bacterium GW2011_GWC1_45_14]HAV11739.1 hypothetical protein [Candidatus Moranbacteria bacterium]
MEQNAQQEVVNSQVVKAGGKTYFFDVKKAKSGNNYLTISETWKKKDGESVRNRLMIFSDNLREFSTALAEAGKFLK